MNCLRLPICYASRAIYQEPSTSFRILTSIVFFTSLLLSVIQAQSLTVKTLDSTGNVGESTSQAVINGKPAISYYDKANQTLKFITALDANGTSWAPPVTITSTTITDQRISLASVNGLPAVSYVDGTSQNLKYASATNASGQLWGTPVTLDNQAYQPSLKVVNGNPAISYERFGSSVSELRYVRALNVSGTVWGSAVVADSSPDVGDYSSLRVINGKPAISYYDYRKVDLKYVRSLDADGLSWGTPQTLDSAGAVGFYTSMATVNGKPAISYYDNGLGNLKFVRALDVDGTSWASPITLDSLGNVGSNCSLGVINGLPSISYTDSSNFDLKYIQAQDINGTNWGTSVILDSLGQVGFSPSLVDVNGNSAISYFGNSGLKWVLYGSIVHADISVSQSSPLADDGPSVIFGAVSVGRSSSPLTFTISNLGNTTLNGLALTGQTENFIVNQLSATSLPAGSGTIIFTVYFRPTTIGTHTTTLHLNSNVVGDKNPFDIPLTGSGVPGTLIFLNSSGTVGLVFYGVPKWTYQVQRSCDLESWVTLATTLVESNGTLPYTDLFPPPNKAFYRISAQAAQ